MTLIVSAWAARLLLSERADREDLRCKGPRGDMVMQGRGGATRVHTLPPAEANQPLPWRARLLNPTLFAPCTPQQRQGAAGGKGAGAAAAAVAMASSRQRS